MTGTGSERSEERPLSGRVAIVTGASSGIGAATARALARGGAAVALAARRTERIEAIAEEIRSAGGHAIAVTTDVADERQAEELVDRTVGELGQLDILVNNAGVMRLGMVDGGDTDEWREMVDVNLFGVLYCTRPALRILAAQGHGDIVNISSIGGRRTSAGRSLYALTKFGLNGFSESLRQEAHKSGVRVTLVMPGFVDTEINDASTDPFHKQAAQRAREGMTPLSSDDVAVVVLFAVSQPPHVVIGEIMIRPIGQEA
jgi:NADP-dependent 3-hydroxy acid dehydrogenase YdfG